MYPNREVFAESPLALVAAEIRFTDAARLRQQATKDEVTIALEERFPFAEPLEQTDFNLTPTAPPQIQQRSGVVLKNAVSTETLTIMSESLTYETTAYSNFDDLVDAVTAACAALESAKVRPALRRIGLRYIDEVRVPDPITHVHQWEKWIDRRLIEHLDVGPEGVTATMTQGITTYDLGEGRGLNFRYAALNQGPVVVPQHLQRTTFPPGPFFVLDFDGYHDFTSEPATPLAVAPTATRTLSLRVDYLRSNVDNLGGEVHELHVEARELDLTERTFEKGKKAVATLLEELTSERGMGWSDIAEAVGVSVSAIRKWRKGGDASPESRNNLARIAALLDVLEEKGLVQDPAHWMEMDLPLGAGYFIRPLDLYLDGHVTALIELAEQRRSMTQVLDEVRPDWRASRSDFEVYTDTDGERSIRPRSE